MPLPDHASPAAPGSLHDATRERIALALDRRRSGLRASYLVRYHAARANLDPAEIEEMLVQLVELRRAVALRAVNGSLWMLPRRVRLAGRAVVLALPSPLAPGEELVEDAQRLAGILARDAGRRAAGQRAGTDPEHVAARAEALVARAGAAGATRTALKRALPEVTAPVLDEALSRLASTGRIAVEVIPGRTKPARLYRLASPPSS